MDEGERPEYPWQIPLTEWAPAAKLSEAERRREEAAGLFEIEETALEFGFPTGLVYDAEADVFRFPDGRFAFSRRYADIRLLEERGY